jgi:hypothetical protein
MEENLKPNEDTVIISEQEKNEFLAILERCRVKGIFLIEEYPVIYNVWK